MIEFGFTFMPKQDILLGINTEYLTYPEKEKEVSFRRISFGFVFFTFFVYIN
jgi:hypothetical protein